MQEVIQGRFGLKPTLIEGTGGAFEVRIDGKKIFSKLKTFRFPENDEILDAIAKLQSA